MLFSTSFFLRQLCFIADFSLQYIRLTIKDPKAVAQRFKTKSIILSKIFNLFKEKIKINYFFLKK